MAKKATTDALEIIKNRYYSKDPERFKNLHNERLNLEIAERIYKLRTKAGLSQRGLAKLVGTSAAAICRLESADYEGHSIKVLRKIADALHARIEIRFVGVK